MTERPTEQTQTRLTGLDAPRPDSDSRPILPPMPREESNGDSAPSLSERLQQKLSSVRQTAMPGSTTTAEPATNGTAPDQTATRPAVREPEFREERPAAAPVPVPAEQPAARAERPARTQKTRTVRASRQKRPPRRARLRLTRVDPWSVMKTAFLLSIALGVVTIVSVLMVWSVLGAAGVWDSINTTVRDIVGDQADSPFTIQNYLGTDRVIGFTMLVAVIDVVLLTAIATLGAFLYNMSAALLGGIDITLVEDER
ncbi:MAG: DUF3566 domain-containing protein [Nocardioides sp.]